MSKLMHMPLWALAVVCVASADTVEDVGARLVQGLQQEVDSLASVQDPASAAAAVEPMRKAMAELEGLNGLVEDTELWNYIDSTVGLKAKLINLVQQLSKHFARLEQADFYGCAELKATLRPMIHYEEPVQP